MPMSRTVFISLACIVLCLADARAQTEECPSGIARIIERVRSSNVQQEAREAAAAKEWRPLGYHDAPVGNMRTRALGTECPDKIRLFKEVLGFSKDAYSRCEAIAINFIVPYVTAYNRLLTAEGKRIAVDICALPQVREPKINPMREGPEANEPIRPRRPGPLT